MKYVYFTPVIILITIYSCDNSGVNPVQNTPKSTETPSAWHYFRYGEDVPFAKEFGRMVYSPTGDTIKLEFCRDSLHSYHYTGKTIRSNTVFCHEHKGKFISGHYHLDTRLERTTSKGRNGEITLYSRVYVKDKLNITLDNIDFELIKLAIIQSEDTAGSKVVFHGVEYWNRDLGQLLRVDENFKIERRRIVKLVEAQSPKQQYIPQLIEYIQRDSSDWVTKKVDGKPWF